MINRIKLFTLTIIICLLIANAGMARNPDQKLAGKLSLCYKQPANSWMTQALPIGNGPMGAMLFGGTDLERIQFNEISLGTGYRMAQISSKSGQACKVVYGGKISMSDAFIPCSPIPVRLQKAGFGKPVVEKHTGVKQTSQHTWEDL